MNTRHLMLDIETAGTAPGCAILEIAAVPFTWGDFLPSMAEAYHVRVDILDSLAPGFTVDPGTAAWHRAQEARTGQALRPTLRGKPVWEAFSHLASHISHHAPAHVWAWGMDFERPILQHAFEKLRIPFPWHYTAGMDARTVWNLAFTKPAPKRPHQALQDCHAQIRDLADAVTTLPLSLQPSSFTLHPSK
jgi:hypothetical protein